MASRNTRRPRPVRLGALRANATKRRRVNEFDEVEWYHRIRRQGDRGYVWCGWGTPEFIEQQLARLVAAGRTEPAKPAARRADAGTLSEILEAWDDHQQRRPDLSSGTVKAYNQDARHLIAWLAEVSVASVDRAVVEDYRDSRLREGASPRTVAKELRTLHAAWRWGRERGLAPARDLPRVGVKIQGHINNHHTPTPEEASSVFEALGGAMLLTVQLLGISGARVASICAVRETDVDDVRGLRIPDTKTGPRRFPIPEEFAASLKEHFAAHGGPLVPGSPKAATQRVRDALARACSDAGVRPFTPHGLRRLVVDRMARSGVDVATAASLVGHSPEVMLRHYRKVNDDDRRRAVLMAGLGHFPRPGTVIEGPWEGAAAAASGAESPVRGTDPGHNEGK